MKKRTKYFKTWREKLTPEKIDKLKAQRRAAYLKWQSKISADPEAKEKEKIKHRGVALKSFKKKKELNPEAIKEAARARYAWHKANKTPWYLNKLNYAREYRQGKKTAESLEKTRQNRRTAAAIDKFGCWNCPRATESAPGGEISP